MRRSTVVPVVFLSLFFSVLSLSGHCAVYYVKTTGSDSQNGTSWELAKATVQAGLNTASSGDEVWVAAGTYVERITLKDGVALYGGFPSAGGDWASRNFGSNVTTLDGNHAGTVVTSPAGATTTARIDGFNITKGSAKIATRLIGGGVFCSSSSPTITNNTISHCYAAYGGGIGCENSSPSISGCLITQNTVQWQYDGTDGPQFYGAYGGGIYLSNSFANVTNNTVSGNNATGGSAYPGQYGGGWGGGIDCAGGAPIISGNLITGNVASPGVYSECAEPYCWTYGDGGNGGGVFLHTSSASMIGNRIYSNTAMGWYDEISPGGGLGGAIGLIEGVPNITGNSIRNNTARGGAAIYISNVASGMVANNIIDSNDASFLGSGLYVNGGAIVAANNTLSYNTGKGAVYLKSCVSTQLHNNIIAFNNAGGISASGGDPTSIRNNCVYGNAPYNYGYPLVAGPDSISANPRFRYAAQGDFHLLSTSPCKDAGYNSVPGLPSVDVDGQARVEGGTIDMGADEFYISVTSIPNAKSGADLTDADISRAIISAAFTDFFYIEADKRSCGIRVEKPNHGLAEGMRADIYGLVKTNPDDERYVAASTAVQSAAPDNIGTVDPLVLGGIRVQPSSVGLSSIGLLITHVGEVISSDSGSFSISNGSSVTKVDVPSSVTILPGVGSHVSVTGISSCEKSGDDLIGVIRVRRSSDIVILRNQ